MFAKSIVLTDAFLDMPMSARCLYFTLGMLADDDGFVGSPKSVMRQCGASPDDLGMLLAKRFVLGFESGVLVIKHWRINNYLQNDRHKPTNYREELAQLMVDEKGAYTEAVKQLPEAVYKDCIQDVYTGKNRQEENSQEKISIGKARQEGPSLDEVCAFAKEIDSKADPERFYDYYLARGWKIGNDPINDWRALFRKWSADERPKKQYTTAEQYRPPQKIDVAQLQKIKEVFGIEDE